MKKILLIVYCASTVCWLRKIKSKIAIFHCEANPGINLIASKAEASFDVTLGKAKILVIITINLQGKFSHELLKKVDKLY